MNRRSIFTIIALTLVAPLAACSANGTSAAVTGKTYQVEMEADPADLQQRITSGEDTAELMRTSMAVIEARLGQLSNAKPKITFGGAGKISITAPGIRDPLPLRSALGQRGKLEFRLVDMYADPQLTRQGKAVIGSEVLQMVDRSGPIVVWRKGVMTGNYALRARQDFSPHTNSPMVAIQFDDAGAKQFEALTARYVGKQIALLVDNQVLSAPFVREAVRGGSVQIEGNFTVETANALAIQLNSGALPTRFKITSLKEVAAGK